MTRPVRGASSVLLGLALAAAGCGGGAGAPRGNDHVLSGTDGAGSPTASPTEHPSGTPSKNGCGPFPPRHAWALSVSSGGAETWRHALPVSDSTGDESLRPILVSNNVVVAQDGTLSALDPNDGQVSWQWHGGDAVYGLWGWGDHVVALTDQVSHKAKLTGLDGATGSVRWQVRIPGGGLYGDIHASSDGVLTWVRADGLLQVVNLDNGSIEWSRQAGRSAALAIIDGNVLFSIDRRLTAYDEHSGAVRWTTDGMLPDPTLAITPGLAVVGTGVSGGDSPTGVVAVDPRSGSVRWRYDDGNDVTVAGGNADGVLLATYVPKRELRFVNVRSGKTSWAANTPLQLNSNPLFTSDLVVGIEGGVAGFPHTRLVARDLGNGKVRWAAAVDDPAQSREPAARFGDLVVLQQFPAHPGDAGTMTAYSIATGKVAWSTSVPTLVQAPMLVTPSQVIVQAADPGYACAL